MTLRRSRLVVVLAGALACTMIGTTSFALQHAAMGSAQCCKSHCKHRMPTQRDTLRCCRNHVAVLAPAASPDAPLRQLAGPLPETLGADALAGALDQPAPLVVKRGPPLGSLLAQHTSQLR